MPTMQCRTSAPGSTGSHGDERNLALRANCEAPSAVRDTLRHFDGIGWILGDAMLVASELVSNAVLHSGARDRDLVHATLRVTDDALLIAVTDPGASGGTARPSSPDDPFGGIGLRLVEQLATRWGSDHSGGYRVWAELTIPTAA